MGRGMDASDDEEPDQDEFAADADAMGAVDDMDVDDGEVDADVAAD